MRVKFLLINGVRDHYWRQVLEDALAPLGTLQVARDEEAIALASEQSYDVIIVDATAVKDAAVLVSRIRARRPNTRIVVATTSPTWTRARDAFYAGATDYIRKSLNKEDLLSTFQTALTKTPPPWPR